MQMIDVNDLVSATYEPCTSFGSGDGSPICAGCGWLETEHADTHAGSEPELAEVFALPAPARAQKRAKRLAS
jgi:predicted Fe-S protein YdhL (DUF1289 family)